MHECLRLDLRCVCFACLYLCRPLWAYGAVSPAGQWSGLEGGGCFCAVWGPAVHKEASCDRRAGDRWSLTLQLTSNLALAIIKPSFLDVSLCSHQTPSVQIQKSHFVSQGSEMMLCLAVSDCVCVCGWEGGWTTPQGECAYVLLFLMFHDLSCHFSPNLMSTMNLKQVSDRCHFLAAFTTRCLLTCGRFLSFSVSKLNSVPAFILPFSSSFSLLSNPLFFFLHLSSPYSHTSHLTRPVPSWSLTFPLCDRTHRCDQIMIKTHAHTGLAFTGEL